jgi:hypothetical protein
MPASSGTAAACAEPGLMEIKTKAFQGWLSCVLTFGERMESLLYLANRARLGLSLMANKQDSGAWCLPGLAWLDGFGALSLPSREGTAPLKFGAPARARLLHDRNHLH